ncbi:MAG: hypothetical protein JW384_01419 [Nitrosomonadaceae bacterium]|nr:hypothetical protein [Nitrosomonadaceae bacterium]
MNISPRSIPVEPVAIPTNGTLSRRAFIASLIGSTLMANLVFAADYPTQNITIVIGFPAGGNVDIVARAFKDGVASTLGKAVIVENKTGAGGAIASAQVARAKADGYTLLLSQVSHLLLPAYQKVDYHPIRDFLAIAEVGTTTSVLLVSKALGVNSFDDLVRLAKSKPGALNYLEPGIGSTAYVTTQMLMKLAGFDMLGIRYPGVPQGMLDLIANRINFGIASMSQALPQVQTGKVVALAVTSPARDKALPNVPTLSELGYADAMVNNKLILYAPKGTPTDVVAKLNAAMGEAIKSSITQERFLAAGITPATVTSATVTQAAIEQQFARLNQFIKN